MAKNTDRKLRNSVIYSVYVRNHTEEGTFQALEQDLERIRGLGTDILWLMPIHPIGEQDRKGSLGCPYAIQDYRQVNPEYGTLDDFKSLLKKIHSLGMKCIIDVVYNHTSPDSVLVKAHPEYFFRNEKGGMGNRVGDWTDIRDLDYGCRDWRSLWDYQIETLKYWAIEGVDGFRCDVASLVPIEFWNEARTALEKVKPGVIWLAETVHPSFLYQIRKEGYGANADCEVYQAFDITYDYDVNEQYLGYIMGENPLKDYIGALALQERIYPANYLKLRFLENHDQPRAAKLFPELEQLKCWTAFSYFQKGTMLLYGGQECFVTETPSLFEKDLVHWDFADGSFAGGSFPDYLRRLAEIKKKEIVTDGFYSIELDEEKDVVKCRYEHKGNVLLGIFNLGQQKGRLKLDIEDGEYLNLTDDMVFQVKNGSMRLEEKPFIFETGWGI